MDRKLCTKGLKQNASQADEVVIKLWCCIKLTVYINNGFIFEIFA